jgi:hypothetical protein
VARHRRAPRRFPYCFSAGSFNRDDKAFTRGFAVAGIRFVLKISEHHFVIANDGRCTGAMLAVVGAKIPLPDSFARMIQRR